MSEPTSTLPRDIQIDGTRESASYGGLPALALVLLYLIAIAWAWAGDNLQLALAALPGVVALLDQQFAKRRYETQRKIVDDYIANLPTGREAPFNPQVSLLRIELDAQRPSFYSRLATALLLTAVLEIPALLTYSGAGMTLPSPDAALAAQAHAGLVWAGYGALIYVLWTMIWRMSVNSLSLRFLTGSAMRTLVALLLGLAASQLPLFDDSVERISYLLVGAFVPWAMESLRARAKQLFKVDDRGADQLPLSLIDGIQDLNVEFLNEVGISEVEHLATTQPAELVIKTLYPLNRVIDWIDQAILIGYVRRNISHARKYGIRGAIDLLILYSDIAEAPTEEKAAAAAKVTLEKCAADMGIPYESLFMVGKSFYYDQLVDLLYRFWQGPPQPESQAPAS